MEFATGIYVVLGIGVFVLLCVAISHIVEWCKDVFYMMGSHPPVGIELWRKEEEQKKQREEKELQKKLEYYESIKRSERFKRILHEIITDEKDLPYEIIYSGDSSVRVLYSNGVFRTVNDIPDYQALCDIIAGMYPELSREYVTEDSDIIKRLYRIKKSEEIERFKLPRW